MKRLLLIIATVAALGMSLALPAAASADYSVLNGNGTGTCSETGSNSSAACGADTKSNPLVGANGVIHNVTILIARIAGVVAIIVIIYSGMQMVIGGSDPGKISTARQTLIYALVGLVVIIVGQTIILFVMDRF